MRHIALMLWIVLVLLTRPNAWEGGSARAEETLRFSTGMIEPWTNAEGTGFHQELIREVMRRLGRSSSLDVIAASSRAIQMTEDGLLDGLAGRVKGLDATYRNLVEVPERMFVNDFVACTSPGGELPADWAGTAPFSVAYVIGWQIFDNNLPKVRELTLAKDSGQLLKLLKAGRTDVILHERWQILWLAKQWNIPLVCADPPLARVPMFIYLNHRHAGLVPAISSTLAAMKADGTYDAIANRVFGGLGASVSNVR